MQLYLCSASYHTLCPALSPFRYAAANLCRARWDLQPDVELSLLTPETLNTSNFTFQMERRRHAESVGQDFYMVADDDCLPCLSPTPWTDEVVEIFKRHPDFAILSLYPQNCTINDWTPEPEVYDVHSDSEVQEHVSVGGIRFMRKGCMKEWPSMPEHGGYDAVQSEYLRQKHYRVGYLRDFKMTHIGEGISTTRFAPLQKAQTELMEAL